MAIPENIIDAIRDKIDIVEVISCYIPLKKVGRNYKTTCPFHNEKTPSFIVSPDKQIYHCFGCGTGGNVYSFVMKHERVEFPEAVEMLAKKAGVVFPRSGDRTLEEGSLGNQLFKLNEAACSFFQRHLTNNDAAKEYLDSRGVGGDTVRQFKIGYAPPSWDALLNFFREKGVGPDLLEKGGLVVSNEKGGYYDRFRNRLIFPIIDLKDRMLGFGARVFDASLPKYINSPETPIYSKGRHLYGLNFSKEHIKKERYALVVEGYLDFIIPYQAGIKNVIATLGTALTVEQVKLVKRYASTVVMAYDPDEAGEAASLRNLDLFIGEDVNLYIAELASGHDPDSYIRKFGAEEFIKIIKSSKNLFDYKLDKLNQRFNIKSTHGKTMIAQEMMPTIARINNAVTKSDLIKRLAEKLDVDEEAIRIELKKVRPDYSAKRYAISAVEVKRDSRSAEMVVLAMLFEGEDYINRVADVLTLEEFNNSSVRDVVNAAFNLNKESQRVTPAKLISRLGNTDEAAALVSEATGILETIRDKDKALADCIAKIKKDNMRDRLSRIQDAIRQAQDHRDEARLEQLITEYNDLVKAK